MDPLNEHHNNKPIQKAIINDGYQPINAGSLNPFHNNTQTFSFNLNDTSLLNLPNLPKLPTFSSSFSSQSFNPSNQNKISSPIQKKRKRPKGIPKYNESPTKKRKKTDTNYQPVTQQHSLRLSPALNGNNLNDNSISLSITNVIPNMNNNNKLSFKLNLPPVTNNVNNNNNKPDIIKHSYNNINDNITITTKGAILKTLNPANIPMEGEITTPKNVNRKKYVSSNKSSKKHLKRNSKSNLLKSKSMPELHNNQMNDTNGYLTRSKRRKLEQNKKDKSISLTSSISVSSSPKSASPKSKKKKKRSKKKKSKKKKSKKHKKTSKKKTCKKSKSKRKSRRKKKRKYNMTYSNIDEYLSNINTKDKGRINKEKDRVKKEKCVKWMSIPNETDEKFNISIRLDKNCISNYAVHKNDINMSWINKGENIERIPPINNNNDIQDMNNPNVRYNKGNKVMNAKEKHDNKMSYIDYDINDDYYNNDYIRLHRINLNNEYINLECPYCNIYLQCISLKEDMICFICFNYPRCVYPLNDVEYQYKYIWNNVKYIGPIMNNKYEDELLLNRKDNNNCEVSYKEIYLSSFGEKKNLYIQWSRQQNRLNKKLNNTINWKKLLRGKIYTLLNKQWNKLQTLKYYNIKTNKEFVYHLYKNKKYKINKLRQKNIVKFKAIAGNEFINGNNRQEYEIKSVIDATKVVLVRYPCEQTIYRTRSQTKINRIKNNNKALIDYNNKRKYSFCDYNRRILYKEDLFGISSTDMSDSDNESNDPSYIPSPIPQLDKKENKLFFECDNDNCLDLMISEDEQEESKEIKRRKRKMKQFEITNIDKLTFIDLYNTSKSNVNYSIKWLFQQLKQSSKRYHNLKFDAFNKCMKQLLKPNAEDELIQNLVLQSMPNKLPLPFGGKKKNKSTKNKEVGDLVIKQLPIFDLKAFANKFKLT